MLIRGDARAIPLRDRVVACCVTSPPYYGLRDYGDDRQIGLEATPEAFIDELVGVFREVRRVMKDDGTLWVNIGDSYARDAPKTTGSRRNSTSQGSSDGFVSRGPRSTVRASGAGAKKKDLLLIPVRVALALQSDGWYLRNDIIWSKPNPMPESVTDRFTKSHEYVFFFSKSEQYYFDEKAIAEPLSAGSLARYERAVRNKERFDPARHKHGDSSMHNAPMEVLTRAAANVVAKGTRNKRSVWTVPTQAYDGAHFATMPEKLVEPCILAGCPRGGLVLDPFAGTGTVVAVARRLGVRGVGIDLGHQALAIERTGQQSFTFEAEGIAV